MEIVPDDPVGLLIGIGEIAYCPVFQGVSRGKGKGLGVAVAGLDFHFGEIDAAGVETGRRTGFEPLEPQAQVPQTIGKAVGGMHTVGTGIIGYVAGDDAALQIGARSDDHGPDREPQTQPRHHGGDGVVFHFNGRHLILLEIEVFLLLQNVLHMGLVQPPVGLGPEGVDGGAFAQVQHPVLDAAGVGGPAHFTAQGVQLPDQMALAGAADGGIAGHIAHGVQIDGKNHRPKAQPGGGQTRFDAGVTGADDGDIVSFHGEFLPSAEYSSLYCNS